MSESSWGGEDVWIFMEPSASVILVSSGGPSSFVAAAAYGQPWRGWPALGRPHWAHCGVLRGVEVGVVAGLFPPEDVDLVGVLVDRKTGAMVLRIVLRWWSRVNIRQT